MTGIVERLRQAAPKLTALFVNVVHIDNAYRGKSEPIPTMTDAELLLIEAAALIEELEEGLVIATTAFAGYAGSPAKAEAVSIARALIAKVKGEGDA